MKKKTNDLDVEVVPKENIGVDSFGFENATKSDLSNDGLLNGIALVKGTLNIYDHMINDPRVDSESKRKLEVLRDNDISIVVGELKKEIEKRINSNDSLNDINMIIDLFKYELNDIEYVNYLEDRLSSLEENKELDFSIMSNEELYIYLNSLEDKIKNTLKKDLDISSNKELRNLLDLGVKLQIEVDRRVKINKSKKSDNSLEDELDDFAKEQDKVRRAKHFSKDVRDNLIDEMEEEKKSSNRRRR